MERGILHEGRPLNPRGLRLHTGGRKSAARALRIIKTPVKALPLYPG